MIRISKIEKRIFWMMDKIAAKYESYGALSPIMSGNIGDETVVECIRDVICNETYKEDLFTLLKVLGYIMHLTSPARYMFLARYQIYKN